MVRLHPPVVVLTDDDLERFSHNNPEFKIEREEDGTLVMSPTHTPGGAKSLAAAVQLFMYAKVAGGKAYDADTGFAVGPGQRVYAPDASWLSQPRIDALEAAGLARGYWPISPDVAIEIKSESDDWRDTIAKVGVFRARGSLYAVAINPETREVVPLGEPPPGLVLDFDAIIDA